LIINHNCCIKLVPLVNWVGSLNFSFLFQFFTFKFLFIIPIFPLKCMLLSLLLSLLLHMTVTTRNENVSKTVRTAGSRDVCSRLLCFLSQTHVYISFFRGKLVYSCCNALLLFAVDCFDFLFNFMLRLSLRSRRTAKEYAF
jgi:hypothetical protein